MLRGFAGLAHQRGWALLHYHPGADLDWLVAKWSPQAVVLGPAQGEWPVGSLGSCVSVSVNVDRSAEGVASVCLDEAKIAELAHAHLASRGLGDLTTFRFDNSPFGVIRERHFREVASKAGGRLLPSFWLDGAVPEELRPPKQVVPDLPVGPASVHDHRRHRAAGVLDAAQQFLRRCAGDRDKTAGGWLDFWVICDEALCHLFFADDAGQFHRSQTALEEFPNGFGDPVIAIQGTKETVFEGGAVYRVEGSQRYLAMIEAFGPNGHRYYRSFTADRLDGEWAPLAADWENPLAASTNVSFASGVEWTRDISHGELIRSGVDQNLQISLTNLRFLYQGVSKGTPEYFQLPYRLGLLTRNRYGLEGGAGRGRWSTSARG